ncbi:MFS transporter [Pleionea sp. CnH1-48]|uniref:MFS transporter n=1 Tax=Pleionea sp. CnH1-48 TaxID=2954494 RepID=UPI0020983BFB|nr:MFS transporter [Pleionea sp. CnH1-48]MCO7224691.1 MFS transporter [Pleionea sp. CnH1-48]
MSGSQFELFKQKRFMPFFVTQALGALNDNIYKTALFIFFTFAVAGDSQEESGLLTNLAAIIFILPFFLFSSTCGQLAEKYEKSGIIRKVKLLEIAIMSLAAIGFYLQSTPFLIGVLFLMGTQSAIFGPIKYGILPQHLSKEELVGGNGLVEMGTFLAILLGMILGGILIEVSDVGPYVVSSVVILIAVTGYLFSRKIPQAPAVNPDLKINFNTFKETYRNFSFMKKNRVVFLSVAGISWFWFFGATIMAQIPNYTKYTLGGKSEIATLILAAFSLGIGLGSMLCERLSGRKVEIGLVPFGAIGLTIFTLDLYFANTTADASPTLGIIEFFQHAHNWRVFIDSILIGVFGGFFIVPLYALIQTRCDPLHISRTIAGNNIMNALFMVMSGIMAITLITLGFSIPEIILVTAVLNALVALYIFTLVPEFLMRFLIWVFVSIFYRLKIKDIENIPEKGACVLVCNHVSFMDALILAAGSRRPIRFVMDHRIFKTPILSFIFKTAKAIPIAPARENPELMEKAFDKVAEVLDKGEVVCIFPEGKITYDGNMNVFKPGIEKIIQRTPVPVIPMYLDGLWGSFFSRKDGPAMSNIPRRFRSKVALNIGEQIAAEEVTAERLFDEVSKLNKEENE